jgi:hypothetical protein
MHIPHKVMELMTGFKSSFSYSFRRFDGHGSLIESLKSWLQREKGVSECPNKLDSTTAKCTSQIHSSKVDEVPLLFKINRTKMSNLSFVMKNSFLSGLK